MTFTRPQRLILQVGTLFCAVLIALNLLDLFTLTGWRVMAVVGAVLFGAGALAVDTWKGGAK